MSEPDRGAEATLDVSALPPPEPFHRILAALATLPPGGILRVLHRRQPWPLFAHLEETGWRYHIRPHAPPGFEILVWREGDEVAGKRAARRLDLCG